MSSSNYIPLEDMDIYKLSMEIGDLIWKLVDDWDYFPRRTVGRQFVEAADSIASNISEGYGRFHFKDKRTFYYYARGSISETKTWNAKSKQRGLISYQMHDMIYDKLKSLHVALNVHIKALPIK